MSHWPPLPPSSRWPGPEGARAADRLLVEIAAGALAYVAVAPFVAREAAQDAVGLGRLAFGRRARATPREQQGGG